MTAPVRDQVWLLGCDIGFSPSPAIHNTAFDLLQLPLRYALHPTESAALEATLKHAERRCRGINITAPFKEAVAKHYESVLDDAARETGAVNTVVYADDASVHALNTDVEGLQVAWRRGAVQIEGAHVAVIGAGGAARAVIVALKRAGARGVVVHARKRDQASALLALAAQIGLRGSVAAPPTDATSVAIFACSALDDVQRWPGRVLQRPGVVHDLRYGARAVALMRAALAQGHLFLDGQSMLLAQAQAAFCAFTGSSLNPLVRAKMAQALAQKMREEAVHSA